MTHTLKFRSRYKPRSSKAWMTRDRPSETNARHPSVQYLSCTHLCHHPQNTLHRMTRRPAAVARGRASVDSPPTPRSGHATPAAPSRPRGWQKVAAGGTTRRMTQRRSDKQIAGRRERGPRFFFPCPSVCSASPAVFPLPPAHSPQWRCFCRCAGGAVSLILACPCRSGGVLHSFGIPAR